MQVTSDSLLLVSPDGRERLPVSNADVARLQLSRGWKSRAGIGAVIGGLAGAGVAFAVSGALVRDGFEVEPSGITTFSVLGFAAGAGVGALVGSGWSAERWSDAPTPWALVRPSGHAPLLEVGLAWSWGRPRAAVAGSLLQLPPAEPAYREN